VEIDGIIATKYTIASDASSDFDTSGTFLGVLAGAVVWMCISHHAYGDAFRRVVELSELEDGQISTDN